MIIGFCGTGKTMSNLQTSRFDSMTPGSKPVQVVIREFAHLMFTVFEQVFPILDFTLPRDT